jgi:hypothetical protein
MNQPGFDWSQSAFHWPPVYEEPELFEDIRNLIHSVLIVSRGVYAVGEDLLVEFGKIIGGKVKQGVMWIQNITGEFQPRRYYVSETKPETKTETETTEDKHTQPVHFETGIFQYNWNGKPIRIGHEESDQLIEAYEKLNIDIVRVILDKHQLVNFRFMKKRYLQLQKQFHPDQQNGNTLQSTEINVSFEKIKRLMTINGEPEQLDFISHVLLFFRPKPSNNDSLAYMFLFAVGATTTSLVILTKKK